jgi:hypothetical protein
MARIIRVFVSYSRQDQEAERAVAFVKWLQQIGKNRLQFAIDADLKFSDSVREFEKSIALYPCVLVLGTRSYRKKILSAPGSGVARELEIIRRMMKDKTLNVFLAVMEGTFDDVFPEDLTEPLAANFVGIFDEPGLKLSDHTRLRFQPSAKDLVTAMLAANGAPGRSRRRTDEIQRKLFFEQKQESLSPHLSDEELREIFVKTSFYDAVTQSGAYLLIGRKGSGKSFLTEYFTRYPEHRNTVPINVHLRDFRLYNIYQMRSVSTMSADIDQIIPQREIFEAAWSLFFMAAAILTTFIRIRSGEVNQEMHYIGDMGRFAERSGCIDPSPLEGSTLILSSQRLIDWCMEMVFDAINEGIARLSGEYARAVASLPSLVDPAKIVPAIIGLPALQQFERVLQKTKSRFLVTVDGFDTKFDTFRRDTNAAVYLESEAKKRVHFEIDWLSGLVEATQRIMNRGSATAPGFTGSARFRFLITLPRDRFEEVLREDRDAFRLRHRHVEIRWSGIELMNLVRKRLEAYFDRVCESDDIVEKFFESLEWLSTISRSIRFEFNDRIIEIDIFSYFLRHSFWRPRDILYHVAELVAVSERFKRTGRRQIGFQHVRNIARTASRDIIRQEFIGEFASIFPDIEKCINVFKRFPIEMEYDRLYIAMDGFEFRLSSGDKLLRVVEKIDFLYEIGFLGIVAPIKLRKTLGFEGREAFSFSDSIEAYRGLDDENKMSARWVIHPIFSEHLQLDTSETPFLLHYDTEYLASSD